jgi:mono/diheme cytochrome c family protein
MRVTNSSKPRFHVFYDMDFSPAKDAQVTTSLFADGRAARPDVPGTVAVGQFDEELDFYTGIDMEALSEVDSGRAGRLVRAMLYPDDPANPSDPPKAEEKPADLPKDEVTTSEQPKADDKPADDKPADDKPADDKPAETAPSADKPAEETKPADEPVAEKKPEPAAAASPPAVASPSAPAANAQVKDTTPWLKKNPLEISEEVLMRGRAQFEIYCVTCHGNDGRGNGLVNRRAQKILASAWVQPSSLHQDTLYSEAYPDGKLFSTISNGIRKMPGYASQIKVRDRWAIVAYVRALQASQNAAIEDIPADRRDELNKLKGEIEAKLAATAEAERKKAEEAAKKKAEEDAKATK